MSLESQVTALVSAASKLTSEIAGKMKGIDQKVALATESVPRKIREMSGQKVHVDSQNGNDANDGSPQKPIKNVGKAIALHVPGSYTEVYLKEGQIHDSEGSGSDGITGSIYFRRWGDTQGVDRPSIQHTAKPNSSGQNRGQFLAWRSGTYIFTSVDIIAAVEDNGMPLNVLDGFFYCYLASIDIFFLNSKISLRGRPLIGSAFSSRARLGLFLQNVEIDIGANDDNNSKLIWGNDAIFALGVSDVSMPAGITWRDLVPIKDERSNMTTNISISDL